MLLALLQEVEREDPVDFSGLPFSADDLRRLACIDVAELIEKMASMPGADRELTLAVTVVRLVLENMVLQTRIAILDQE